MKKYERLDVIEIDEQESGYTLISDVVRCLNDALEKGATLIDIGYLQPIVVREETKEEYSARLSKEQKSYLDMIEYHKKELKAIREKLATNLLS